MLNWSGALSSHSVERVTATSDLTRTFIALNFSSIPLALISSSSPASFFLYPSGHVLRTSQLQATHSVCRCKLDFFRKIELFSSNGSLEIFLSDTKKCCCATSLLNAHAASPRGCEKMQTFEIARRAHTSLSIYLYFRFGISPVERSSSSAPHPRARLAKNSVLK